jgi:hypothetical protein
MKTYGGVDVEVHVFLIWALDGSEWSSSGLGHFTPGKIFPVTYWVGVPKSILMQ